VPCLEVWLWPLLLAGGIGCCSYQQVWWESAQLGGTLAGTKVQGWDLHNLCRAVHGALHACLVCAASVRCEIPWDCRAAPSPHSNMGWCGHSAFGLDW
jgi:hypothetical protein